MQIQGDEHLAGREGKGRAGMRSVDGRIILEWIM
jgi:hypothetical protein